MRWDFSFPTINVNVAELPSHDAAMARVGAMANPEMDLVGDNSSNEIGACSTSSSEQVGKPEVILPPAIPIRFRSSLKTGVLSNYVLPEQVVAALGLSPSHRQYFPFATTALINGLKRPYGRLSGSYPIAARINVASTAAPGDGPPHGQVEVGQNKADLVDTTMDYRSALTLRPDRA